MDDCFLSLSAGWCFSTVCIEFTHQFSVNERAKYARVMNGKKTIEIDLPAPSTTTTMTSGNDDDDEWQTM